MLLVVKNVSANAGEVRDMGSIPGGGHSKPLWYSCLENPLDRGTWKATVHRVAKSQTRLKRLSMHAHIRSSMVPFEKINKNELNSLHSQERTM